MKAIRGLLLIGIAIAIPVFVHAEDAWDFKVSSSMYAIPDQFYGDAVFYADRNHLHLEARYNYEDLDTVSFFVGYNFTTGENIQLSISPIIGGVIGNSDGIAPGLLVDLNYKNLSFWNESEYFVSSKENGSNYFYSWSEAVYTPAEWIWFGMAGQRTRAYKTDVSIQRGPLLGFGKGSLSVTGYWMNPGLEGEFVMVNVEFVF